MEWKHEVGDGTDKDSNGSFLGRHFSRDLSVAGGQVGHRIGQNGCDLKKIPIVKSHWRFETVIYLLFKSKILVSVPVNSETEM